MQTPFTHLQSPQNQPTSISPYLKTYHVTADSNTNICKLLDNISSIVIKTIVIHAFSNVTVGTCIKQQMHIELNVLDKLITAYHSIHIICNESFE